MRRTSLTSTRPWSRRARRGLAVLVGATCWLALLQPAPVTAQAEPPTGPFLYGAISLSRTTAEVHFGAPGWDGGSKVTRYRAACVTRSDGTMAARWGAASPITVRGLQPGIVYQCQVRAQNAIGTGPDSSWSPPFRIRPGADYRVQRLGGLPTAVRAGRAFTLTDVVANVGARRAPSTGLAVYLSAPEPDPHTVYVGARFVPPLDPGARSRGTTVVVVPASTSNRTYSVNACVNRLLPRIETNSMNNCRTAGELQVRS
jgi:hypothetical protein